MFPGLPLEFFVPGTASSHRAKRAESRERRQERARATAREVLPAGHFWLDTPVAATIYVFPLDEMPGQSHSLVVGSLFALEGVERSLSGLPPACRGLIGVCNRALNGISGARPRGWEGIGRRSVTFGSGFCREAAFRDGVKSYVDVLRARASRHRRGATRSGRLRRGRGRSRR